MVISELRRHENGCGKYPDSFFTYININGKYGYGNENIYV
jgi:hypothetical protein